MPSANRWNENLPVKTLILLTLSVLAVAVFIFLFGTGLYGAMSPAGHGGKETYFTPSSYVFYTWSIIDVLLLGYVIYQFFDSSADAVNGIGWRFAIVAILNAIFTHVYVTHHYIVAFIFSLFVASSVSTIYYSLAAHYPNQGALDALFVHLPFSLWHAWSIVTIFISGFAAFTHGGHGHHPSVTVKVLVVLSSAFLASTAVAYSFKSRRGDVAGAAVLAWTLFGIYDHQHGTGLIHYFALGSFIVSLLAILKSLYFTFIANDGQIALGDNERAPLVG